MTRCPLSAISERMQRNKNRRAASRRPLVPFFFHVQATICAFRFPRHTIHRRAAKSSLLDEPGT